MELLIFFLVYLILFFSVCGYGFCFNRLLAIKYEDNIGIIVILGLIFLTLISYVTIFFIPHNYLLNLVIFFIGFIFFLKNFRIIKNLRFVFFITTILFIGLLVSKTHDDFAFYHFQTALNLTRNKIQIGLSNLDFSYAKHSSLLYLNSLFNFPYFKYYFFNAPNQLFLTGVVLALINFSVNKKDNQFLKIFSLMTLFYILLKFTRSAEYGTDIIGQLLILIFTYLVFYFFLLKDKLQKEKVIILSGIICLYCFTIKTYFILYFLIYALMIYKINIKDYLKIIINNKYFLFFLIAFTCSYITLNIFSSGCIIYPIPFLCFENLLWAMPKEEVIEYKIWYEKWAKSIAGAGYVAEDSDNLIKNLYWVKIWFKNYFFGRFLDNLILIITISILFLFLFSSKNKKEAILQSNFSLVYSLVLFISFFWFFKHPALRYGGYAPFFLIFLIPVSLYLNKFKLNEKKFLNKLKFLIFFGLIFFVAKNFLRISHEFDRNDMYKYINFPYYNIPEVKFIEHDLKNDIKVYEPLNNNCWNIPSPCPYKKNLKAKKINNYIVFYKE